MSSTVNDAERDEYMALTARLWVEALPGMTAHQIRGTSPEAADIVEQFLAAQVDNLRQAVYIDDEIAMWVGRGLSGPRGVD